MDQSLGFGDITFIKYSKMWAGGSTGHQYIFINSDLSTSCF